jgi:hypothetical protein
MILKQDKIFKLHLESFRSGNHAHFHLEQQKSNWNGMLHGLNRENQTRIEWYMSGTKRGKISISLMPGVKGKQDSNPNSGNTKGGSITVPLTSCLTGLD